MTASFERGINAFKEVIDAWDAKSPRNHELLEMTKAEIQRVRNP